MILMAQIIELAIGESPSTRYVVEEQLADGRVVLLPQTELERMHDEMGTEPLTSDEFDEFLREHGDKILPPDGEG
jgi:hypothetical protein